MGFLLLLASEPPLLKHRGCILIVKADSDVFPSNTTEEDTHLCVLFLWPSAVANGLKGLHIECCILCSVQFSWELSWPLEMKGHLFPDGGLLHFLPQASLGLPYQNLKHDKG